MSGSVGDFIIGGLAIGASFLAASVGLGFLAAPLFAYGSGRIISGISKLRSSAEQRIEGAKLNIRTTQGPIPVVYGISRVGLRVMDMRIIDSQDPATPSADPSAIFSQGGGENLGDPADDDDVLMKVGCFALGSENGSGIQAVNNIRVYNDGVDVIVNPAAFSSAPLNTGVITRYQNHFKYVLEDGDDAQTTQTLVEDSLGWGSNMKGQGVAYGAFFMFYNRDVWQSGVPQIPAEITGNRVYDPRSSAYIVFSLTGASSDNPALCILDYLTSKRYGGGVPYAARDGGPEDFINEQSFIDSANYCDDLVVITGIDTEKRFKMNAVIDTSRVVGNNLSEMLATCRGELIWQNGTYRLVIRQVTTPEIFELTEDNIVGPIEWVRKGSSIPNMMECTFPDSRDGNFSANTVVWPLTGDTVFLDEDNGVENRAEVALPYTTGYHQAIRTIMVMLREARNDVLINLTATQAAYKLEVGKVVKVTHEGPGFNELLMTVRQMALSPDGLVKISLQQYTASAYTLDSLVAQPSAPTTNLPDSGTIDPVTALVLTADETTTLLTQDGQAVPRIRVQWTPPVDLFLSHYECQFFRTSTPGEIEAIANPQRFDDNIFIWPVTEAVEYTVQIRAINSLGVKSAFVSDTVVIISAGQPDFSMSAALDVSQAAVLEADGNAGVKSYKIAFASGFAPLTEPTDTAVRARGFIDGRKLSISDINAAYSDIPVLLNAGEGCLFKAFAYSLIGGVGNESLVPVTAFVTRFVDLVYLNLNGGLYTISEDVADYDAAFVFDLSEGVIKIQDSQQAGAALAITGASADEILILAAPDVP